MGRKVGDRGTNGRVCIARGQMKQLLGQLRPGVDVDWVRDIIKDEKSLARFVDLELACAEGGGQRGGEMEN